jgi:hypothetical protein
MVTAVPDREAIIDAVTRERPWRTSCYLILFFLRRWAVVLFTLSFLLASRQHWTIIGIATLAALWFDLKVTPNAVDLRLGDRGFVRKIYDLEEFESDIREKHRKIIMVIVIILLFQFLASIFGRIFVDFNAEFSMNKFIVEMVTGAFAVFCIASTSRMNTIYRIQAWSQYEPITLKQWSKHGYNNFLRDLTLPLSLILIFSVIAMTLLAVTILPAKQDATVNDYVVFSYTAFCSIAGFGAPTMMNIPAKGQKVAKHILKKLEEGKT